MKTTASVRNENQTFRALYLIAILFVVDGHMQLGKLFELNGLFRYYSFHLMLFAFGAGYFFRLHGCVMQDIAHRARRLLVPLYAWNAIYGVGAALLRHAAGFGQGEPLSAYTLLLAPLTDGEHFSWNLGAWFIFPLFLVQVAYAGMRRLSRLWGEREGITFLLCLMAGAVGVTLCRTERAQVLPLFLLRAVILLPGYAGGQLYRRCLEHHDTLPTVPYLLGIVVLRTLLCTRYENLAYLLSSCTYFVCDAFGVYAGAALAIAFFLRVARLLAPYVQKSRLASYASRHTFDIMMHHFMGFFAVNGVFLVLNMLGIGAADFSVSTWRRDINYAYAPDGHVEWNVIYVMAGMLLPLAVAKAQEAIRTRVAIRARRRSDASRPSECD